MLLNHGSNAVFEKTCGRKYQIFSKHIFDEHHLRCIGSRFCDRSRFAEVVDQPLDCGIQWHCTHGYEFKTAVALLRRANTLLVVAVAFCVACRN